MNHLSSSKPNPRAAVKGERDTRKAERGREEGTVQGITLCTLKLLSVTYIPVGVIRCLYVSDRDTPRLHGNIDVRRRNKIKRWSTAWTASIFGHRGSLLFRLDPTADTQPGVICTLRGRESFDDLILTSWQSDNLRIVMNTTAEHREKFYPLRCDAALKRMTDSLISPTNKRDRYREHGL